MAYPRRLLTDDEEIDLELHPHAKALVLPVLVLLVVVPVASFGAARVPAGGSQTLLRALVAVLAVLLLVRTTLVPFLRWVTTHYVVTTHRLIVRRGVLARSGRDIPLARVNDVSFSHNLWERLLGCGTVVVESAGERGQLVLEDVPHVEDVQRRIYELVEDAADERDDGDGATGGGDPAYATAGGGGRRRRWWR